MKRIHLIISGLVQGVGYRSWVKGKAQKLGVTGWVKNRDDGTVELMVEGSSHEMAQMIELCRQGPPAGSVERMERSTEPYKGEFHGFTIAY